MALVKKALTYCHATGRRTIDYIMVLAESKVVCFCALAACNERPWLGAARAGLPTLPPSSTTMEDAMCENNFLLACERKTPP